MAKEKGNKKEAKVEKPKRTRKSVEVPPAPPPKVGGVVNPLLESQTIKRAMALAILTETRRKVKNEDKAKAEAARLIRLSGIPYHHGITEEKLTDPLNRGEWDGTGYVRWALNNEDYPGRGDKQTERFQKTVPFAKAMVDKFLK